jgi:hypothetical protein
MKAESRQLSGAPVSESGAATAEPRKS